MPWNYNQQAIRVGRGWTNNDGIKHPYNWNNWSAETKAAQGLVWEDEPASFDSRFYWAADLPKALDNVDAVDEDGNPMLDEDGVQIVTLGLKSYAISTAKSQAAGLLSATDWYVPARLRLMQLYQRQCLPTVLLLERHQAPLRTLSLALLTSKPSWPCTMLLWTLTVCLRAMHLSTTGPLYCDMFAGWNICYSVLASTTYDSLLL
jgi:hypothetical protein